MKKKIMIAAGAVIAVALVLVFVFVIYRPVCKSVEPEAAENVEIGAEVSEEVLEPAPVVYPEKREEETVDAEGNETTVTITNANNGSSGIAEFVEPSSSSSGSSGPSVTVTDTSKNQTGSVTQSGSADAPQASQQSSSKPQNTPAPSGDPVSIVTPAPSGTGTGASDYEWYMSLSPDEQYEFYMSFEDPADFFKWLKEAKAAYDAAHPAIIINPGDVIELS